ncbi:hypothetical protein FANTH_6531 [Fusarium anthophilum]|uniref:Intradiol ring-cleavage dioxygenases domain-containing protein n=1 Tax=Fusarium anthophilum TaxID=48485 RepID=A0A8H4ZIE4_9HYPO|nr:hypothetical protein FANTH_6531 [Fusarium anthophilum]
MRPFKTIISLALLACHVIAHEGHDAASEAAARAAYFSVAKRTTLSHCTEKLQARGIVKSNMARRDAVVQRARHKRGLTTRSMKTVLETSHNKTGECLTPHTDPTVLFSGYNSCMLSPNVPVGPYYVAGERIRECIVEDQEGIPLLLDFQVIDVDTCDPIPGVFLDIWHANSTGVYGGIVADGNGNANDTANINKTFLRGVQETNREGVAQFSTIFPGHYTGRPTHIHIIVHTNTTVQPNNTLGFDSFASSIGQIFFDQDLIYAADKLPPYNTNQQAMTLNVDDKIILPFATQTDGLDPVVEYTMLGDKLEHGLFGWLALGVNMTWTWEATPASFWGKDGGEKNPKATDFVGAPPGFSMIDQSSSASAADSSPIV